MNFLYTETGDEDDHEFTEQSDGVSTPEEVLRYKKQVQNATCSDAYVYMTILF